MEQCLDKQDLLAQVGQGLRIEEKHLIYLELMIMEQVADWEVGTGNIFFKLQSHINKTKQACPKTASGLEVNDQYQ